MKLNLPNTLTLFRIAIIPILCIVFLAHTTSSHLFAAAIFIIASITDWLDGYIARKYNQSSDFGAFLDPVADKIMVCTCLILLTYHYQSLFLTLCSSIIIGREIFVSALREWMAQKNLRATIAVSWIGKWKTTFQMIAIIGLFLTASHQAQPIDNLLHYINTCTLSAATLLTIWSMIDYIKNSIKKP